MYEEIILVNEQDVEIGYEEKINAHRRGKLHRAFSIFIFDWQTKKILLQKRADSKYHSGGLWTNACCSHPHKGESMDDCLRHRLRYELGLDIPISIVDPTDEVLNSGDSNVILRCGKFIYRHSFGDIFEHEVDHVFLYSPDCLAERMCLRFNSEEISELKWISIKELQIWLIEKPEEFTAWFAKAYEMVKPLLRRKNALHCEKYTESE